jgi:hypothetical protein
MAAPDCNAIRVREMQRSARVSHQLSSRGRRGAVPSGVFDPRGAESYFTVRRAPRGEKTPLGAVHRWPQQKAGEKCGLGPSGHPDRAEGGKRGQRSGIGAITHKVGGSWFGRVQPASAPTCPGVARRAKPEGAQRWRMAGPTSACARRARHPRTRGRGRRPWPAGGTHRARTRTRYDARRRICVRRDQRT